MKNYVKPAAFAVAFAMLVFSQSANASGEPHSWFASMAVKPASESRFNIALDRQGNDEVIVAKIENPGKKNLSIILSGPDGAVMDNFYTGRKFTRLSKQYNFTGAEEGVYTLTITDGVEKVKKQVKLERIVAAPVSKIIIE